MTKMIRLFLSGALGLIGAAARMEAASFGSNSFANAPQITGTVSIELLTDATNYTAENGEPFHGLATGGHSAWWKWTAPADGFCTLETLQTGVYVNSAIAVYTGATLNGLARVAQGNGQAGSYTSKVTFYATAGTTYSIAVDSTPLGSVAEVLLQLRFLPAEARRFCANWQSPNQDSTPGSNGFLTLSITATGGVTGVLVKGTRKMPFKTQARADGIIVHSFAQPVTAENPHGAPITLTVDPAYAGTATLNPGAIFVTDGAFLQGKGYLLEVPTYTAAAPCPHAGTFNVTFDFGSVAGRGFAVLKIDPLGKTRLSAVMGDGQAISVGSIVANEGAIAIHRGFANGAGFLNGRMTVSGKPSVIQQSILDYRRPAGTGVFYPSGFAAEIIAYGLRYAKPAPGERASHFLDVTGGMGKLVTLDAPGELGTLSEPLNFTTANQFLFTNATRKPALKLNPATGLVSGSIVTEPGVKRSIKGILARDFGSDFRVRGLITGQTRTAGFVITP